MNKYDFNVGDIVEDIDGKFGYISSICHCKKCEERGFYEPTILYEDGTEDYISNYSVKTVHLDYRRIGKYKFSKQILRKNIKKSISWYALWKRIGKQPIYKTQNSKVQVFIDGELRECALVFTNNGSDFHLEPVGKVVIDDNSRSD